MNIKWSEDEKDFIRANSAIMKDSVRKVRQKLGITKLPGRGVCGLVCQDKQEGAIDGAVYTIPDRTDRVSG